MLTYLDGRKTKKVVSLALAAVLIAAKRGVGRMLVWSDGLFIESGSEVWEGRVKC